MCGWLGIILPKSHQQQFLCSPCHIHLKQNTSVDCNPYSSLGEALPILSLHSSHRHKDHLDWEQLGDAMKWNHFQFVLSRFSPLECDLSLRRRLFYSGLEGTLSSSSLSARPDSTHDEIEIEKQQSFISLYFKLKKKKQQNMNEKT